MPNAQVLRSARLTAAAALLTALIVAIPQPSAAATILRVPGQYSTIQAAIDAASDGDIIRVGPGTYWDYIDFTGKNVTVESRDGAETTILARRGVTFESGEGPSAVLRGFTFFDKADITVQDASPTIEENILEGRGIWALRSSATIRNNTVTGYFHPTATYDPALQLIESSGMVVEGNVISDNSGPGIVLSGSATIRGNQILRNGGDNRDGGGIVVTGGDGVHIEGNYLIGNGVRDSDSSNAPWYGGGVGVDESVSVTVVNNVIVGNHVSRSGGGIYVDWRSDAVIANNTVVSNVAPFGGSELLLAWEAGSVTVANNILLGSTATSVVQCEQASTGGPFVAPSLSHNNIASAVGNLFQDECPELIEMPGTISAIPTFHDPASNDYLLVPGSPGIDAGSDTEAPLVDFRGMSRPQDGDGTGGPAVDMGAYELHSEHLAGLVTSDAIPVDQICVELWSAEKDLLHSTKTGRAGRFVFENLTGSFKVKYKDCTHGLFIRDWYPGGIHFPGAPVVDVDSTGVGGVDIDLSRKAMCGGLVPTLWGTNDNDEIVGTGGNDVIAGLGGDDVILGKNGDDIICGGKGDDTLRGNDGTDVLYGFFGADLIDSGPGHDMEYGGGGHDTFIGGPGDDQIEGQGGNNTVDYRQNPVAVDVDLKARTASGAGTDALVKIRNVIGTDFDDVIAGDGRANDFDGGDGDDILNGRNGPDRLDGNGGNDLVEGSKGDDELLGGEGENTLTFERSKTGVTGKLNGVFTGEGTDTVRDFVNVIGSKHADTIDGSIPDNVILGLGGDDTLSGGRGEDWIDGGSGADILKGGESNDTLLGASGDDELIGGDGQDLLVPEGGIDIVDGGLHNDYVTYELFDGGVTVDLATGTASGEGADTLIVIEAVFGSTGDDRLYGDDEPNALVGYHGDDRLYGRGSNDVLDGMDGTDVLDGGTGTDVCYNGESHSSCETIDTLEQIVAMLSTFRQMLARWR